MQGLKALPAQAPAGRDFYTISSVRTVPISATNAIMSNRAGVDTTVAIVSVLLIGRIIGPNLKRNRTKLLLDCSDTSANLYVKFKSVFGMVRPPMTVRANGSHVRRMICATAGQ